jgi:hypothetical protein
MPAIRRLGEAPYRWDIAAAALSEIANQEKLFPRDFISDDGFGITDAARRYLTPLIAGEAYPPFRGTYPTIECDGAKKTDHNVHHLNTITSARHSALRLPSIGKTFKRGSSSKFEPTELLYIERACARSIGNGYRFDSPANGRQLRAARRPLTTVFVPKAGFVPLVRLVLAVFLQASLRAARNAVRCALPAGPLATRAAVAPR